MNKKYNKIRIAHVVWGMETGGVETMLVNIINEQVKTEKVALFIVNDYVDESIINKISPLCIIYFINRKPKSEDIWKPFILNWKLLLFRPNIVHLHSDKIYKMLLLNWRKVRTIHGFYNNPEEYSKMDALFAISEAVKDFTIKQGFDSVVTINNGIIINSINTKKKYLNSSPINIVQVGRLWVGAKGQDILLKALAYLKHERRIHCFKMFFIGSGPSEKELKHLVSDLQLESDVVFEGKKSQDDIFEKLCEYDLFIQPSRHDGFGLTVAEAMAAGLPIIVSDFPGPLEVIDGGKCGWVFRNGDIKDLAEKIELFIKGNYDYQLIENAHKRVQNTYDVTITAKKYIEEYKKVIKNAT